MAASRPVRILAKRGPCARAEWSTPCSTTSMCRRPTAGFSAAAHRTTGAWWPALAAGKETSCACWAAMARGWCSTPKTNPHVGASRSDIHILRHTAGQHWAEDFWEEISPKGMKQDEHHQNAIAVLAIDPAHPRTLWV